MSTITLEQRVARIEAKLAQIPTPQALKPEQPWWQKIVGTFADDPYFEEAVTLGRQYRESLAALEATADELTHLPEKSQSNYSLPEAIAILQQPISTALQRHYTFAEIAQILTKQGIAITATELKHYHQSSSRSSQIPTHQATQPA